MSLIQLEGQTLNQLFKMSLAVPLPFKCVLSFLIAPIIYLVLAYSLALLEEIQHHESRGFICLTYASFPETRPALSTTSVMRDTCVISYFLVTTLKESKKR